MTFPALAAELVTLPAVAVPTVVLLMADSSALTPGSVVLAAEDVPAAAGLPSAFALADGAEPPSRGIEYVLGASFVPLHDCQRDHSKILVVLTHAASAAKASAGRSASVAVVTPAESFMMICLVLRERLSDQMCFEVSASCLDIFSSMKRAQNSPRPPPYMCMLAALSCCGAAPLASKMMHLEGEVDERRGQGGCMVRG